MPIELLSKGNWSHSLPIIIVIIVLASPLFLAAFSPIEFNQFLIQKTDLQHGIISGEMIVDMFISEYSLGINALMGKGVDNPPSFENDEEMFAYLFSHLPSYAIVYPTERFYYFTTTLPDVGPISGNIRLAELEHDRLSMAYFTTPDKNTIIRNVSLTDGIHVRKITRYLFEVTFNGKTVRFKIPQTDITYPENLLLLPSEKAIGQIHDESDIRFFLLFNRDTNSFYNVLNDEKGVPDAFEYIREDIIVGKRTGFAYYVDANMSRKILIGVDLKNVEMNNFFDGPADQVPIAIPIRDLLHLAYPNTLLGSGIDEYGVYLNRPHWVRIAITPFIKYASSDELFNRVDSCSKLEGNSNFFTCLTKEWWNTPAWREDIFNQLAKQKMTQVNMDKNAN